MEELRLSFIIGGAIAIFGVLCHGLWSVRKRNQVQNNQLNDETASDNYDEGSLSISDDDPLLHDDNVELVMLSSDEYEKNTKEPTFSVDDVEEHSEIDNLATNTIENNDEVTVNNGNKKPEGHHEQTLTHTPLKPNSTDFPRRNELSSSQHEASSHYPEPPESLLKVSDEPEMSLGTSPDEQIVDSKAPVVDESQPIGKMVQKNKMKTSNKGRVEPSLGQDQIRIDFEPDVEIENDFEDTEQNSSKEQSAQPEQEVLVLNVRMDEGEGVSGASLLPMLLTLGFKFGDQDIFHRHVNSNGKGPVLFSLANMFKPGVFDIDNLENFTTQGVSLFMILPIEGDAHQVFNMMHNAARKIADEFGGKVLDGRRSALNKQSLQQYVEKIREFERRRMIRR